MPIDKDYYDEKELRGMQFKSVGCDVRVSKMVIIRYPEEVTIGDHVAIDAFTYISVKADIGNYVHIATSVTIFGSLQSYIKLDDYSFVSSGTVIICGTDDYKDFLVGPTIPKKYRKITFGQVIFEKCAGTGANVTIMPNVTIGEGTTIGAATLVTKSLEPWGVYIGIPAKRYAERNKEQILGFVKELESEKLE
jgi:galactoside O-acetyltransferase